MGVDVYMRWRNQTDAEQCKQFTGWQNAGEAGYLREPYFRKPPSVLDKLIPEGWERGAPEEGVAVPAKTLRQRLPEVIATLKERYKNNGWSYDEVEERAIINFVELAERQEAANGEPVTIRVSY